MELDTVALILKAFYRLVGSTSGDDGLTENDEGDDDVAYVYLTRGCRAAQLFMIGVGYDGWRQRSSALSWTGTDDTTGGRYSALPSDFLRTWGSRDRFSALREASGKSWGRQIDAENDQYEGDYYYIRGEQLWITRKAAPPTTLYLEYHYTHPEWSSGVTIDFKMDCRSLIVAEAANLAKEENWLPGGPEMERKIDRALKMARTEARDYARPTKSPRQMRKPYRAGNHW